MVDIPPRKLYGKRHGKRIEVEPEVWGLRPGLMAAAVPLRPPLTTGGVGEAAVALG